MIMRTFLAVAATVLCYSTAQSASLTSVDGSVMVNKGTGFKPSPVGTQLKQGDRVIAVRKGSARISFKDGCDYNLKSGQILTIAAKSPCANPSKSVKNLDLSSRMGATGDEETSAGPPEGTIGPTELVVGGALVAGAVAGIIVLATDDDPASP